MLPALTFASLPNLATQISQVMYSITSAFPSCMPSSLPSHRLYRPSPHTAATSLVLEASWPGGLYYIFIVHSAFGASQLFSYYNTHLALYTPPPHSLLESPVYLTFLYCPAPMVPSGTSLYFPYSSASFHRPHLPPTQTLVQGLQADKHTQYNAEGSSHSIPN
jgi:hypothetical protein